jgi:hypothetical protein
VAMLPGHSTVGWTLRRQQSGSRLKFIKVTNFSEFSRVIKTVVLWHLLLSTITFLKCDHSLSDILNIVADSKYDPFTETNFRITENTRLLSTITFLKCDHSFSDILYIVADSKYDPFIETNFWENGKYETASVSNSLD